MFTAALLTMLVAAEPAGHIAFMRGGKVWLVNVDGTGEKAVSDELMYKADRRLTWSPDGKRLLYASHSKIGWDIWSVNVDGTNQKNLTNTTSGGCRSPAFSPDGKLIAFMRDEPDGLFVMNADGTQPRQLVSRVHRDATPAWSPDGQRLTFVRADGGLMAIGSIDLRTGKETVIAPSGDSPAWSPDGKRLLYIRHRGGPHLVTVALDGSDPIMLMAGVTEPTWSPDGAQIAAFTASSLLLIDVKTKTPRPLLNFTGRTLSAPSWSPDGRSIVFAEGPDGRQQTFVVDVTSGKARKLSTTGACYPVWQPVVKP